MRDSQTNWQRILSEGFSSVNQLLQFLHLPEEYGSRSAENLFITRVPIRFAKLMEPGNKMDPLLLQVLPVKEELNILKDFSVDPLHEKSQNPVEGLIHKYKGRVLLTFGTCAINCRYCFRRHFSYEDNNPYKNNWHKVLEYIKNDSSIHEIILSGGDPLLVSNARLENLFEKLSGIAHIKTVRIHTRVPVVLPERIDDNLQVLLKNLKFNKVVVLHTNHPREIDDNVNEAVVAMREAGCVMLSQSVLLKNVNDSARILTELSHRLFSCGIMPYYLHMLDKVQGSAHFEITKKRAIAIFTELQSLLPGYLVPRLVTEEPCKKNKTLISLN